MACCLPHCQHKWLKVGSLAKDNLCALNKAQALRLQRQRPDKGMPEKNLLRKVTSFWFSHCTSFIMGISD